MFNELSDYQKKILGLRYASGFFFVTYQSIFLIYLYLNFILVDEIFNRIYLLIGLIPILTNFLLYIEKTFIDYLVYSIIFCYNLTRTLTIQKVKDEYYREILLCFLVLEWITGIILFVIYLINYFRYQRQKIKNAIVLE
jgi:hypothetical protein